MVWENLVRENFAAEFLIIPKHLLVGATASTTIFNIQQPRVVVRHIRTIRCMSHGVITHRKWRGMFEIQNQNQILKF